VGDESLIQQWFDAGDAGSVDAFDRFLWPDVVVHAPMGLATEGIDAERDVWLSVLAGVPDLRHDVKEVLVDGDTIAARVVVTGTHLGEFVGLPATGKRFEIDQTTFGHVRDGKLAEVWEVADTASLLKQLGAID
jgi:steroid delta-isomerase-like uncharacterized protein